MATHFIPNALISVFREDVTSGEDAWGQAVPTADPSEADAAITGVPAFISEYPGAGGGGPRVTQTVFQPGGGRETTVKHFRIRVRPRAFTYRSTDRVRDSLSGVVYEVDEIMDNPVRGIVSTVDVSLLCRRVS